MLVTFISIAFIQQCIAHVKQFYFDVLPVIKYDVH